MTALINPYPTSTNDNEQMICDHLLYAVQTESPESLIDRFRRLFIGGRSYEPVDIRQALEAIAVEKGSDETFPFFLNRCCHILVNRWQLQTNARWAIPELVQQLQFVPPVGNTYARGPRRLRQLMHDFLETEQYRTLQRLATVIQHTSENQGKLRPRPYTPETAETDRLVGQLINRYPYLYEHCLLSQDSSYEHQQTVRHIRDQLQMQFELDLSHYVTYQLRLQEAQKRGRLIHPVENPTLLSDRELDYALRHFVGRIQGNRTSNDLAKSFLTHSLQAPSFRIFKDDLYEYLISSVDPRYGKRKFNDKLYERLQSTLPRYDNQKPNNTLLLRTSSHLLNFLVVESPQRPNHYVFVDLVTNLGATPTILLLLKITLLCHQVKPSLEKRFAILFNHYESSTEEGVPWLVQSMENIHVALSTHFGALDLSYLKNRP